MTINDSYENYIGTLAERAMQRRDWYSFELITQQWVKLCSWSCNISHN